MHRRQTVRVSTFLKVAIGLLLTLPLGAYIAGTLVASQATMPERRPAVVITQSASETASTTPTPRPSPSRTPDGRDDDRRGRDDDIDDRDDDGDDDVQVVRPTPREVDDDRDDHDDSDDHDDTDDRDDRDDDSGDDD